MNERIKEIRKVYDLNQREFSKRIDIGASTLAMFETGDRVPKDIHIKRLCSEFDVDENWLRTGKGAMFPARTPDEQLAALTGKLFAEENDFKKKMIGMMLEMSDDEWTLVEKFIDKLAKIK